jgi:hypothetical protein
MPIEGLPCAQPDPESGDGIDAVVTQLASQSRIGLGPLQALGEFDAGLVIGLSTGSAG